MFSLNEAALGTPVKYLGYDLLNRYGMIHKFKVPPAVLECFLGRVEEGYCRHRNPYHNNLHAADVAQTMHHILCQTGLMVRISSKNVLRFGDGRLATLLFSFFLFKSHPPPCI